MNLPAVKPSERRIYPPEFKQQIVDQCQPGISIAGMALAHGLNANLLRRWIRERAGSRMPAYLPQSGEPLKLVPLSVQKPMPVSERMIEISVVRKGVSVNLRWPVSAADALSDLLTCWLK